MSPGIENPVLYSTGINLRSFKRQRKSNNVGNGHVIQEIKVFVDYSNQGSQVEVKASAK